jgi:hypothetical protein
VTNAAPDGVRELLERYAALGGGSLEEISAGCYDFVVPAQDRSFFGDKERIRIALSVEAAEHEPEAELAILGSVFVEQLVSAIRARGSRFVAGSVEPATRELVERAALPIPVRNGMAGDPTSRIARHRVGRLTARVVMRAGTFLEEQLVESSLFDLVTGAALGADVAEACDAQIRDAGPAEHSLTANEPLEPSAEIGSLIKRMLVDLETRLRPNLDALHEKSKHEVSLEVGRIERYYASLLADMGGRGTEVPTKEAREAVEAEKVRRIREEEDRHSVRATVHPVQLTEWEVGVQRAEWRIRSNDDHEGMLTAQRTLAGSLNWVIACPSCGATNPATVAVCVRDHVGCDRCARVCSVCGGSFCADHGIAACHVDGAPSCEQHARTCPSCRRPHCSAHEGECADGGHPACTTCLTACASCGRVVCDRHAETTTPDAPRGRRRLCMDCVRTCEGGANEIVGPDEVARCATCGRDVCERHQAQCAVDNKVHCSRHLRRTDRSRRLVCEHDRAACAQEPNAIFAVDEVQPCPACTRLSCATHMRRCLNCYRTVCSAEYRAADSRNCSTCAKLEPVSDPPDALISAAVALRGADGPKAKSWKVSRDATHMVVELDFGWTRRLVFTVPHGDDRASSAVSHSMLGSRIEVPSS